eukprot:Skav227021  [mRNA]  locus=scaffold456:137978:140678:+ [translate_table: standard]
MSVQDLNMTLQRSATKCSAQITSREQAPYLHSRLENTGKDNARAIRRRLRLRLGALSAAKRSLHEAVSALGLTRYSLQVPLCSSDVRKVGKLCAACCLLRQEVSSLVDHLAGFINLRFEKKDVKEWNDWTDAPVSCQRGVNITMFRMFHFLEVRYPSLQLFSGARTREAEEQRNEERNLRLRESHNMTSASWMEMESPRKLIGNVVPVQALMEILLAEDGDAHRRTGGGSWIGCALCRARYVKRGQQPAWLSKAMEANDNPSTRGCGHGL